MKRNLNMKEMIREKNSVCFIHGSIGKECVSDNLMGYLKEYEIYE